MDLAQHPGWSALARLQEACAASLEADVLKCDLSAISDRDLVVRKARAEGARRILASIKSHMEQITAQVRAETAQLRADKRSK